MTANKEFLLLGNGRTLNDGKKS